MKLELSWIGFILIALSASVVFAAEDQSLPDQMKAVQAAVQANDLWTARSLVAGVSRRLHAAVGEKLCQADWREAAMRRSQPASLQSEISSALAALDSSDQVRAWVHIRALEFRIAGLYQRTPPGDRLRAAKAALEQELLEAGGEARWVTLHRAAQAAHDSGAYADALEYATRALAVTHPEIAPGDSIQRMQSANLLGLAQLALGNREEAKAWLARSLDGVDFASFRGGPSLQLAAKLLAAGEQQTVIEFLNHPALAHWVDGIDRMNAWKRALHTGKAADFGISALQ